MTKPAVLIIDDEDNVVASIALGVGAHGFESFSAGTGAEGLRAAKARQPQAVLLDLKLPDILGIDLIAPLRALYPDLPIIMISAHGDIPMAVEAVRRGARDFLSKPFELDDLVSALQAALVVDTKSDAPETNLDLSLVGHAFQVEVSELMRRFRETVEIVARSTARSVLLLGSSGVGKGYTAHAIHEASARVNGPFIVVNCAALPGDLLESELFGVEKGAFTGAVQARSGLVEAAEGGTLFLDEIGEVPLRLQAKLLRFLESRTYRRLGATKEQPADVRVIAATNRDLEEEVEAGRFRADLYYRLNVMPLTLPDLREHPEDIVVLARHFARRAASLDRRRPLRFSEATERALTAYGWPGNVRELSNLVERLSILYPGRIVEPDDLPLEVTKQSDNVNTIGEQLENTEREILTQALRAADGHKGRAAEALGISRHALKRRLQRVGMA